MDDFTKHDKTPSQQPSWDADTSANSAPRPRGPGLKRSLTSVDQVLNKLVGKLGLDRRLKEHAFLSLWPTVVNSQLAAKSRPLFIDSQSIIVIAVKEAAVAQELSLMKTELLNKLRPLGQGLNIPVKGIRFDLKHFHTKEFSPESITPRQTTTIATDDDLAQVALSGSQLAEISELRRSLEEANAAPDKVHKMLAIYERELRLKRWRETQNFARCPQCAEPAEAFYGRSNLCRDCYFESMSTARDI